LLLPIRKGNVALIHLKTPRTKRLRFLAGQHVKLGGNGIPLASHPVGSCPCDDMHLHFFILITGAWFVANNDLGWSGLLESPIGDL
jgi:NAD(P)H-flavin reductase